MHLPPCSLTSNLSSITVLTWVSCPAALRFEEVFMNFIRSGEQRMLIDESLSGFGVCPHSPHICVILVAATTVTFAYMHVFACRYLTYRKNTVCGIAAAGSQLAVQLHCMCNAYHTYQAYQPDQACAPAEVHSTQGGKAVWAGDTQCPQFRGHTHCGGPQDKKVCAHASGRPPALRSLMLMLCHYPCLSKAPAQDILFKAPRIACMEKPLGA